MTAESQASVLSLKRMGFGQQNNGDVKRLTESELQEKRAKGLCYRCDAKWAVGHRCKKKELSVMLIAEEEGELEGEESEPPPSPTEEILTEVSLNSVVGISNPRTMKLRGLIWDNKMIVMIDPRATHNFISLGAVAALGIPVEGTIGFGVSLGNGEAIRGEGVCRRVTLQLDEGLEVVEDFLPLQLGSSDVILGIAWLEKLGMVLTDWKSQVMKFEIKGEPITLVGDPSLIHSQISLKAMKRTLRKQGCGFWVECNGVEKLIEETPKEEESGAEQSELVSSMLQKYKQVFDVLVGLPPSRNHEHNHERWQRPHQCKTLSLPT